MLQVKIFDGTEIYNDEGTVAALEEAINAWFKDNQNIELIKCIQSGEGNCTCISVFYIKK